MKNLSEKDDVVKIERYTIVISVQVTQKFALIKGQDIDALEKSFIKKRDTRRKIKDKVELDRVRTVLKYASTCGAQLGDYEKRNEKLSMEFIFGSLDSMVYFKNHVNHVSKMVDDFF